MNDPDITWTRRDTRANPMVEWCPKERVKSRGLLVCLSIAERSVILSRTSIGPLYNATGVFSSGYMAMTVVGNQDAYVPKQPRECPFNWQPEGWTCRCISHRPPRLADTLPLSWTPHLRDQSKTRLRAPAVPGHTHTPQAARTPQSNKKGD